MKDKFFLNVDDRELYGLLEGPDDAKRLVIVMHGFMMHSRQHPFYDLVRALWDEGYATLRFDFNGHGRSQGQLKDMTMSKVFEDAEVFYQYAKTLENIKEIIPLGYSMGAVAACNLARNHKEIKQMVLLSPAANIKERALMGNFFGMEFDPDNIPEEISDGDMVMGCDFIKEARTLNVFAGLSEYEGRALIVYGGADEKISEEATLKYRDYIKNLTIEKVDAADHEWTEGGDAAVEIIKKYLAE